MCIRDRANALALWNEFKVYLSEDFLRDYYKEVSFNTALLEIEDILNVHNLVYQFPRIRREQTKQMLLIQ